MINQAIKYLALLLLSNTVMAAEVLFSAPPTESAEDSQEIYQPVADYLSAVSGDQVTYVFPGNWPNYLHNMQQGNYDLVLDAPHFVSWRIENIAHRPIVGLSSSLTYVIVIIDDNQINSLADLEGKKACASALPNLDAIILMDQYSSGWSQPSLVVIRGMEPKLAALLQGQCDAAVLPKKAFETWSDKKSSQIKILFESQISPHYGFTVGPGIPEKLVKTFTDALLSVDGDSPLDGLSDLFGLKVVGENRVVAREEDYQGYAYLLGEYWGF